MSLAKSDRATRSDLQSFLTRHAGSGCDVLVRPAFSPTLHRFIEVATFLFILNSALLIAHFVYGPDDSAKKQPSVQAAAKQKQASVSRQDEKQYKKRSAELGRAVGRRLQKLTHPRYRTGELKAVSKPVHTVPESLRAGPFKSLEQSEGETCRRPSRAEQVPDRENVLFGAMTVAFCRKSAPDGSQARILVELDREVPKPHEESFREALRHTKRIRHMAMKDGMPHALRGWEANDLRVQDLDMEGRRLVVSARDRYGVGEQKAFRRARLRHALKKKVKPGVRAHYRAAYDWLGKNDRHSFKQLADDAVEPDCSDCSWSDQRYSVAPATAIADRYSKQALAIEVHNLPDHAGEVLNELSFEALSLDHRQYLPQYRGGTYRLIFDTLDD